MKEELMRNLDQPVAPLSNVFIDKDHVLYLTAYTTHTFLTSPEIAENAHNLPFWSIQIAIGGLCEAPLEIADGIFAFIDEEDNLMAIHMPVPAQNGVPTEAILAVLRDWISEEEIIDIMENVQFVQTGPLAGLLAPTNEPAGK
jgi:hypothetical protein